MAPELGGVTVSWNVEPTANVTYEVHSIPAGLGCRVVGVGSCVIADTASVPYSFSVVASASGVGKSPASTPTIPLAPHLILVVAGQSNAAGVLSFATDPTSGINYMAPPYTNGADANDLITWEPWTILQGIGAQPVPLDSPQQVVYGTPTTIFGPEIGLARQLWADKGRSATIIKAAYPGSDLAVQWSPSGSGPPPNGLFPAMVGQVTGVMTNDAMKGQFDVLGGVYFYQGESDASEPSYAKKYKANLKRFIVSLRSSLPMAASAPVVLAKEDLSAYDSYLESTGSITAAQKASLLVGNAQVRSADDWAAAQLRNVVEVDTVALPRIAPWNEHLSNTSELTLGEELAAASEPLLP